MLNTAFKDTSFTMTEAQTGQSGLAKVVQERPDLILLDIGLPDMSGVEIIRTVREWSNCPILMLSASGHEQIKVECLESGADDYITKPFSVNELMARLRVAHRRHLAMASPSQSSVFEAGLLRIDFAARIVWVCEEKVHLTPLEYKLLSALVKHAGKVVTHRQLLSEVWGPGYTEEWQYLRLYIGYLRKKLPSGGDLIHNEPGVGYRLVLEP